MSADDQRQQYDRPSRKNRGDDGSRRTIKPKQIKPERNAFLERTLRGPRPPTDRPGNLSPAHIFFTTTRQGKRELAFKWFGFEDDDIGDLSIRVKAELKRRGYRDYMREFYDRRAKEEEEKATRSDQLQSLNLLKRHPR